MLARLFAIVISLGIAASADAAQISVRNGGVIAITGNLEGPDAEAFRKAASTVLSPATVVFEGNGGSASAGLIIGEEIKRRSFATLVKKGTTCASACAFAWLAGSPKLMETDAKIGFHAVYVVVDGKRVVSAPANALVGSYMTTIGMTPLAIVFATEASPDKANWLTPERAKQIGIEVHELVRP